MFGQIMQYVYACKHKLSSVDTQHKWDNDGQSVHNSEWAAA